MTNCGKFRGGHWAGRGGAALRGAAKGLERGRLQTEQRAGSDSRTRSQALHVVPVHSGNKGLQALVEMRASAWIQECLLPVRTSRHSQEPLGSLHPWRFSRRYWMRLWAAWCDPVLQAGVGRDLPGSPQPGFPCDSAIQLLHPLPAVSQAAGHQHSRLRCRTERGSAALRS